MGRGVYIGIMGSAAMWTVMTVVATVGMGNGMTDRTSVECASVGSVGYGTVVMEEASAVIASVYAVGPGAAVPDDGAVEVVDGRIAVELSGREHHPQVMVAHVPPGAIDIGPGVDAHEVIEVDSVDFLILCFREPQFVSHFVAEEEGFVACLVVCHCAGRDGYRHHHGQKHHLFHIFSFLQV